MEESKKIKLRRLAQLLLFKRHRYPGVKEWELEKYVGRNYRAYLNEFNKYIEVLGLKVKEVEIERDGKIERYFVVVPITPLPLSEVHTYNLSIIDLAALSVIISMILTSRDKKVKREEVEEILKTKFKDYEVKKTISKLIRMGYINESEEYLSIGLRSMLEVDLRKLSSLIISYRESSQES